MLPKKKHSPSHLDFAHYSNLSTKLQIICLIIKKCKTLTCIVASMLFILNVFNLVLLFVCNFTSYPFLFRCLNKFTFNKNLFIGK